MPKETVHDEVGQFDVTVGWATDRDVQVGVQVHDGTHSLLRQLWPELFEALDASDALRQVFADLDLEPADFRGVWVTLDRGAVNRTIRLLRMARDSAYGRDE